MFTLGADAAPKFEMGALVATHGAASAVTRTEAIIAFMRHGIGDWGDLGPEGRLANERAMDTGGPLLSAYHSASGAKFFVMTEADRSVTTLFLPSEY